MTYLCKPWAAGVSRTNEIECEKVYFCNDSFAILISIDFEQVPFTIGIGDGGGRYKFFRENGWILEFKSVGFKLESWIIYYSKNDLIIEIDGNKFFFEQDDIEVNAKVFFFVAKITVHVKNRNLFISRLIFFPLARTLFIEDSSAFMECLPITHLFSDLRTPSGYMFWKNSWQQGLRCVSSAITFPQPIKWTILP